MDVWSFYIEPNLNADSLIHCLLSSAIIREWMETGASIVSEMLECKNAQVMDHFLSEQDGAHQDPQTFFRSRLLRQVVEADWRRPMDLPIPIPMHTRHFLHKNSALSHHKKDPLRVAWKTHKREQGSYKWARILCKQVTGLCALNIEEAAMSLLPSYLYPRVQAVSLSESNALNNLCLFPHLYTLHLHQCTQLSVLPSVQALILESCQFHKMSDFYQSIANAKLYLDMTDQIWESADMLPLQCKTICLHSCEDRSPRPNPQAFLQVTKFVACHSYINDYHLPQIQHYKSIQNMCHFRYHNQQRQPLGPRLHSFTYESDPGEFYLGNETGVGNHAPQVCLRGNLSVQTFLMPPFAECTHLTLDSLYAHSLHNIENNPRPLPKLDECHIIDCPHLEEIPGFMHCKVMHIQNCPALQVRPSFIGQQIYVDSVLLPANTTLDIYPIGMDNFLPRHAGWYPFPIF